MELVNKLQSVSQALATFVSFNLENIVHQRESRRLAQTERNNQRKNDSHLFDETKFEFKTLEKNEEV